MDSDEDGGRWGEVLYGGWGEAALGAGCALLLMWAFGQLAHWWWILPLSALLGAGAFHFVLEWLEPDEPEPPPAEREAPPLKPRKVGGRRKAKVIDFTAERERRAGVQGNG